jgi:type IV secretory pathway protease TraF
VLIIGGTVSNTSTSVGVPGDSVAQAGAGVLVLARALPQWRSQRRTSPQNVTVPNLER